MKHLGQNVFKEFRKNTELQEKVSNIQDLSKSLIYLWKMKNIKKEVDDTKDQVIKHSMNEGIFTIMIYYFYKCLQYTVYFLDFVNFILLFISSIHLKRNVRKEKKIYQLDNELILNLEKNIKEKWKEIE